MQSHFRFALVFFKCDGDGRFPGPVGMAWVTLGFDKISLFVSKSQGVDDLLWLDDFAINALAPAVAMGGIANAMVEGASNSKIEAANVDSTISRRVPVRHVFGIGPCLEHKLAWSVENTGDEDLALVSVFGRHVGEPFGEAIECLVSTFHGAKAFDARAFLGGGEQQAHRDSRFVALCGKCDCDLELTWIIVLIGVVLVDKTFRGYDLKKDNSVRVIGAIRAVHHETPDAAGLHFEFVKRVRETLGSPPVHEMLRVAPCLKYQFARSVEDAR